MNELDKVTRQRFKDERSGRFGERYVDGPDPEDDLGDDRELFEDGCGTVYDISEFFGDDELVEWPL